MAHSRNVPVERWMARLVAVAVPRSWLRTLLVGVLLSVTVGCGLSSHPNGKQWNTVEGAYPADDGCTMVLAHYTGSRSGYFDWGPEDKFDGPKRFSLTVRPGDDGAPQPVFPAQHAELGHRGGMAEIPLSNEMGMPIVGTSRWAWLSSSLFRKDDVIYRDEKIVTGPMDGRKNMQETVLWRELMDATPRLRTLRQVTHSGHHVLSVTPEAVTVWDVVGGQVVDQDSDGPLHELATRIYGIKASYGSVEIGRWWLTDDLRYIVIAPPLVPFEAAPPNALPAAANAAWLGAGGVIPSINLKRQVLVYDRTARSFKTMTHPDGWMVVDVEMISGRFSALGLATTDYRSGATRHWAFFDLDDQRVIVKPDTSTPMLLHYWDTRSGAAYFVGATGGPDPHRPNVDAVVHRWTPATGKLEETRLSPQTIDEWIGHR